MIQFITDTLFRTADLALIALGLSLVYGLVKFPNITYLQYGMSGAFLSALLINLGVPVLPALIVASLICGGLAVVLHKLVFESLAKSGAANAMIGSFALSMVLVAIVLGIAGSSPIIYNIPLSPLVKFAGVRVSEYQFWTTSVTIAVIVIFAFVLFRTSLGRAIRVLASNQELAAASGINPSKIVPIVNLIAGTMAGLGGALLGVNSSAYINQGNDLLLPVLTAAILGGLGNPIGAVFGALIIAATETLATNIDFGSWFSDMPMYIPITYINAISFVVLLLTLIAKPYGLFNKEVHRV